ncbi:MAG: peptide chain release factor N(5)-glutamine methyltransferase [Desulfarculus sp.]|nr:peptide chain release factor N(5)-glutamine methyltransferase [Desulfarculus sp.]
MTETWTIGKLIPWAAQYLAKYQVAAPRLSGELMLAQVLGCTRVDLYLRHEQPLTPDELAGFKALLLRRRSQEPLAYILGRREFYGLDLLVGPGVLVPRPESEHLVEEALKRLEHQESPRLLDLCTGSGAVALACLSGHPGLKAVGVDISPQALDFARRNAARLGLEGRAQWLLGDLWEPLAAAGGFFEVITANPPYVRDGEWAGLSPEVKDFEPRQALVAGPDGLEVIEQILVGARAFLRANGWLFLEMGQGQAAGAMKLARGVGIYQRLSTVKDLAGIERVLCCQRGDYG